MVGRRLLGTAFVLVVSLVPAAAQAATYCAGTPTVGACDVGYPATGAGLQAALDAAESNFDISGTPDTVRIGPGTFTAVNGFLSGDGDVRIEGSGESTVLTRSGGAPNQTLLGPRPGPIPAGFSVRNLRLDVVGAMSAAIAGVKIVSDVHVAGPGAPYIGIDVPSGGRLSRAVIEPAGFPSPGKAVGLDGATVEDTLIRLRRFGNPPGYVFGVVAGTTTLSSESTIRHVTVVGDGGPRTSGVLVQVQGTPTATRTATVHVRDTVFRGVDLAYDRAGYPSYTASGTTYQTGTANLDVRYSSFAAAVGRRLDSGPGATMLLAGNLDDPDPRFDATGRPTTGSPLIDAGDPALPLAGDSATDLGGGARIFGARRDIGAYEFVPGAPGPGPTTGLGPSPTRPGSDVTRPVISALKLSARRFRVAAAPTAVSTATKRSRRPPAGTNITFALSEAATVALTIARRLPGRLVKTRGARSRRCVRPTKRNAIRGNRRCVRYGRPRALTRRLSSGTATVAFSGRIGRARLAAGPHRLVVVATDAAGNRSRPKSVGFMVITP